MIEAEVIKDSISKSGKRITTFILTYPRYIHAELNTHRALSRCASSSRAITSSKIIRQILKNPAIPTYWGKNKPGMQAEVELDGMRKWFAKKVWLWSRYLAILSVLILKKIGLHKEITNRIIEPWMNITVVCTATEWNNFYYLRCDKHAHPDFRALAEKMLKAHNNSVPEKLDYDSWHLPFILESEKTTYSSEDLLKFSVARCARVSYLNHDKSEPVPEKDIELHDTLLKNGHMSPFEHQAIPTGNTIKSGNFIGWEQYRKMLPNECVHNFEGLKK